MNRIPRRERGEAGRGGAGRRFPYFTEKAIWYCKDIYGPGFIVGVQIIWI